MIYSRFEKWVLLLLLSIYCMYKHASNKNQFYVNCSLSTRYVGKFPVIKLKRGCNPYSYTQYTMNTYPTMNTTITLPSVVSPANFETRRGGMPLSSQNHGIFWDKEIRECVFGLSPCENNTHKYDVSRNQNMFNSNENVSIKTTGSATVCCGDIMRFYTNEFDGDVFTTIILVMYNQTEKTKQIREIVEFMYTQEVRDYLFGDISLEELRTYVDYIKSIPKGKVCDTTKREYKLRKRNLQEKNRMVISISPKLDSKTQRRVQCTIPDIYALFKRFPGNILYQNTQPVLRYTSISHEIESTKRVRKTRKMPTDTC